jgi:hypothetical protein
MWHPSWKLTPHLLLGLVETRTDIPSRQVFIERQMASMSKEEAENRLESFSPVYSKHFRMFLTWLFILLSFVFCAISAVFDLSSLSNGVEVMDLFPRSGAILVAVALWLEYEPNRLNYSSLSIPAYTSTQRYATWLKAFEGVGVLAAVCGTIIWAYGDILLKYLCQ